MTKDASDYSVVSAWGTGGGVGPRGGGAGSSGQSSWSGAPPSMIEKNIEAAVERARMAYLICRATAIPSTVLSAEDLRALLWKIDGKDPKP